MKKKRDTVSNRIRNRERPGEKETKYRKKERKREILKKKVYRENKRKVERSSKNMIIKTCSSFKSIQFSQGRNFCCYRISSLKVLRTLNVNEAKVEKLKSTAHFNISTQLRFELRRKKAKISSGRKTLIVKKLWK